MESTRLRFLFGDAVEPDREDLDDIDVRARLLERSFGRELSAAQLLGREIVANKIYADDPPEVWATADRLLAAGLEREDVFRQLAMAFAGVARSGIETGGFDRDSFVAALHRLPLPTADAIEKLVIELVRSEPGIGAEALDDATLRGLGYEVDDDVAGELVGRVMDHLVEDLGPLAWISGDRTVHVGDLTAGIVLTHRLTETERDSGALEVAFDLAGFIRQDDLSLGDGETIEVAADEPGTLWWEGPRGWLDRFSAGDLLAVRVSDAGLVDLEPVDVEPPVDPTLVARLRSVYDTEVEEPWLPVSAEDLLLGLQFEDRTTFARLQPPLSELCDAAGLQRRGDEVAHDTMVWHSQLRGQRIWRVMDAAGEDRRLTERILHALDLADLVAGVDPAAVPESVGKPDRPALRSALSDMADAEVLTGVAIELFDSPEPGAAERAGRFVEALLDAASRPAERSAVRFLASIHAERSRDLAAAEEHLETGLREDPDSPMLADRLAWYASDRGDAARAVRLWRALPRTEVIATDLREVERAAGAFSQRGGRNQPCWCGSGRKYKHCHLGAAGLEPLPDRVGWLCRKAVSFMERRGGSAQADAVAIAIARAADPDDPDSVAAAFDDPIVMDLALTEGGWFARFLGERGPMLPDDEALLAQSWLLVDRTVYEVLDVRPGDGLELRDLRTGEHLTVRERTFSRETRPGALVCARAVPDGHTHQLVGGLFPVAPGTEGTVLDLLDDADPEEIAAHVAGFYRPPRLLTREGEELVECDVVLEVADPEAARSLLDATYEADEPDGDRWVEMHPVDDDERILRATITLDGTRLSITTMSEERADRVLDALRIALPGLRLVSDRRRPLDELLREPRQPEGPAPVPAGAAVPDDVIEEICDRFERRWCDESVPALGGLTPREAAGDPTRRGELVRLIDSFEAQPVPPGGFTMRPDRLRRLLELSDA